MTDPALIERQAREQLTAIQAAWPAVAAALTAVKETRAWEHAGLDDFKSWLGDLNIGHRVALEHIAALAWCYEHSVSEDVMGQTTPSKLAVVIPAVRRRGVSAEEGLGDAIVLSRSDLRAKYQGGGEPAEYATCEVCGHRARVPALAQNGGSDA